MESIDFDFLASDDEDQYLDDLVLQAQAAPRDPRVVRTIGDVADDAEARLTSRQASSRQASGIDESDLGFNILSLHESELESLWPAWGERRVTSLGRGIPPGVSITPQYLPNKDGGEEARPISYK